MSDIIPDIRILIETRKYIFSHVNELSESQLLHIPEKFKTNILWNIGHLVATQQILHYFLSGLPPLMKEDSIKI
ncbi:MAG: DinB family protein, partial [Spirochaetia bacterium]|nr:DinB family protein [Spirochaetia bacterium]